MSELIALRQRMKAIETIKKVTHAMRIMSMSAHARLKTKKSTITSYQEALMTLFGAITQTQPTWQHPRFLPTHGEKTLHIVIGSQKGLCGNFNLNLLVFFERAIKAATTPGDTILIGKKLNETAKDFSLGTVVLRRTDFTQLQIVPFAKKIVDYCWEQQTPYRSITLYHNAPKTFFTQVPQQVTLIPFQAAINNTPTMTEQYHWEQQPEVIIDALCYQLLQAQVQQALLQSLTAEQAARFLAMDNATTNASNLLDATKTNYNKLRQAKITRELTDLAASL